MKTTVLTILIAAFFTAWSGQNDSTQPPSVSSTWSVHTPDVIVAGRSPYLVGVLTPSRTIVIRQVPVHRGSISQ